MLGIEKAYNRMQGFNVTSRESGLVLWKVYAKSLEEVHLVIDHYYAAADHHLNGKVEQCPACQ